MESEILKLVLETFKILHQDGLIYRDERLVNYCPHCGTAFSELEVIYKEREDPLYFMKYGPFTLATVRPTKGHKLLMSETNCAISPIAGFHLYLYPIKHCTYDIDKYIFTICLLVLFLNLT